MRGAKRERGAGPSAQWSSAPCSRGHRSLRRPRRVRGIGVRFAKPQGERFVSAFHFYKVAQRLTQDVNPLQWSLQRRPTSELSRTAQHLLSRLACSRLYLIQRPQPGGTNPPHASSTRRANSSVVRSSKGGPMIRIPIGIPPFPSPIEIAVAGNPFGAGNVVQSETFV